VSAVLAIISAMQEEIALIVHSLTAVQTQEFGRRQFHVGRLHGEEVVAAFSRWGKVAAAATVTQLLAAFPVSRIVLSGVAGAVRPGLAIGDVVVASGLIQHDLDARPIFARYEIPLLSEAILKADPAIGERLHSAASQFLAQDLASAVPAAAREFFRMSAPKVHTGLIGSGDKFFASALEVRELAARLPDLLCVEMEGAAVAQVCHEYGIPFGVVRTISDSADENAGHYFPRFLNEIARHYSAGILARFMH
jgi:adenosylhomocysteine nucleosidase